MKEKKKKRKILAALIPVAVLFLAVVVFAQGVLKSEPQAVPNPVKGISADSSLKGYLGTGFAYAVSKTDGNGEEAEDQQEQADMRAGIQAVVQVRHPKYGVGVLRSEDDLMVEAEFDGYGVKQFLKAFGEVEIIG